MQSLGVTSETTDEQIESIAQREAPKAAAALGCATDADEFAAAMRAYRDECRDAVASYAAAEQEAEEDARETYLSHMWTEHATPR
jgi:hypothetical protein